MIYFFIEILILIGWLWCVWIPGRAGIVSLLISSGAKKRRPVYISDPPQPVPAEYQAAVDELTNLGFSRLGETLVKIPSIRPTISRIFISADKLVFAELTEIKIKNSIFTTVYSDDAVVETGFPFGENIETAFFRSHTITTDLEKAYRHQVQQLDSFGKIHGAPRKIETMQDYLACDAMYRTQHASRKFRRITRLSILQILALVYGAAVLLAAIGLWWVSDKTTITPLVYKMLVLLAALAPAALVSPMLLMLSSWGSRRETKSD
jgi:hypothetical protein